MGIISHSRSCSRLYHLARWKLLLLIFPRVFLLMLLVIITTPFGSVENRLKRFPFFVLSRYKRDDVLHSLQFLLQFNCRWDDKLCLILPSHEKKLGRTENFLRFHFQIFSEIKINFNLVAAHLIPSISSLCATFQSFSEHLWCEWD